MNGEMRVEGDPIPLTMAAPPRRSGDSPARADGLGPGEELAGFSALRGVDGRDYSLGSFAESDIIVVAFLGNACPAVKALASSLVDLQRRLAPHGVQVVAVNSNNPYLSPRDSLAEMEGWAVQSHLNFPYVKDLNGELARRLGATNTPHFILLDRQRILRYRGRMFDSREPHRATTRDLESAVRATLEGTPIDVPETNPLGCSIVW